MNVTAEHLVKAVPQLTRLRAAQYVPALNEAMSRFKIDTPTRQAAFLAQIFHESGNLQAVEENLNYSADALRRTWPSRFKTDEIANEYARKPQKIANKVYANRMGNRDEASGDGWKFRGAGLIQLTGKDNHYSAAMFFGIEFEKVGDWLRTPEGACLSAAWFWSNCGANKYADKEDFDGVSDVINIGRKTEKAGDAIGYAHRLSLYKAFKGALGVK